MQEFWTDGLASTAEQIIKAELADFHWDGRISERNLGAFESADEEEETFVRVVTIGYFHGRYYTAICIMNDARGGSIG